MGGKRLNIFEGLKNIFFGNKKASDKEIELAIDLVCAASKYSVRSLCWETCVDLIASAFGRCDFITYENGKEVRNDDWWLWNIEPNTNQNSTAFLHKLVSQLYDQNEALIIRTGSGKLVVADSFSTGLQYPDKQNEYTSVTVGDFTYDKTFRENKVMHLRQNHKGVKPILESVTSAQEAMIGAAERYYRNQHGNKLKVHVDALASNDDDFGEKLNDIVKMRVKPFFENDNAVLVENDGWKYEMFGNSGTGVTKADSDDIRNQVEDVFNLTARALLIPAVLSNGSVEATGDAEQRFLSRVIDPLADQLQEEANRKYYDFNDWKKGNFLKIDTSSIQHFDLFAKAPNVEKIIGTAMVNINDVRRAAGKEEIDEPWAKAYYMTRNLAPVGELLSAAGEGR